MSENPKFNEYKEQISRILNTMFDFLSLEGTLTIEERGQKIGVKIASEDAGRIIGRKGQTLDSLQLILNRILFKQDEECPHVMLDIDGYANGERERRSAGEEGGRREFNRRPRREHGGASHVSNEQLEQQARDAAIEVKRWGEPVKLPEMNAHDRRIIHVTLKDDPEVTTESIGEGAMKKVVISLAEKQSAADAQ